MKSLSVIVLCFLLHLFVCQAQELDDPMFQSHIQPLSVGDTVPEILIPSMSTGGDPYPGKLSMYKDRLLILDFWTTTCVSCIAGMPKLDRLSKLFPSDLGVLLSTYEKADFVRTFRARNPVMKNLNLPSAVADEVLGAYFPHLTLPHLVWIYKGIVKAITGSEYVTEENVRAVLAGTNPDWPVKKELLNYDYDQPLLHVRSNTAFTEASVKYAALLGYQDGLSPKVGLHTDSVNHTRRGYIINLPIVNAYFFLLMKTTDIFKLHRPSLFLTPNQLVVEGDDLERYWFNPDSSGYLAAWKRLHTVCLELVEPDPVGSLNDRQLYAHLLMELDHLLGIHVSFERRHIRTLHLRRVSEAGKPGENTLVPVSAAASLVYQLNLQRGNPPVFDDSGFSGALDVQVSDWRDVASINSQLSKYGLVLQEERQDVDLFVIRK